MTTPPSLVEFLLERIDEDERLAQDQLCAYQHVDGIPHYFRIDRSIVGMTPRIALAECAAKRRIIELHASDLYGYCATCALIDTIPEFHAHSLPSPCPTLLALAAPYSADPGFDPRRVAYRSTRSRPT